MAKNDLEYSLRMIDKSKDISKEKLDYTPLVIPFSDKIPETTQSAISRILLQSGQLSREEYNKLHGIVYEYDDDSEDSDYYYDDFDDELEIFKQTNASYDDSSFDISPSDIEDNGKKITNVPSGDSGVPSTGSAEPVPGGESDA